MAISIGKLYVIHSGGAANTDQMLSLGGAISTAGSNKIQSQVATAPSLVTGVTIIDAMGNALGAGTLRFNFSNGALQWVAFGGVEYNGPVISGDGIYTLGSVSGYLVVNVVAASLPGSTVQENITISNATNKTFDNITAQESLIGKTEYRCFYIKNTDTTNIAYDVRLWIKSQPIGDDTLSIALNAAGKNQTALGPLADEADSTNVLSGLVFSAPSLQVNGLLLGDLSPGDYYAFWMKRVIPPNTTQQVLNDTSSIGISASL